MATGYEEFESKMKKTSELLTVSFASVRAGRANAAVLDQIQVDYYGTPTPIQQIATISTPDPVSYTHLDVYKRQGILSVAPGNSDIIPTIKIKLAIRALVAIRPNFL